MSVGIIVETEPDTMLENGCYCQNLGYEHGAGVIKAITQRTDCTLQSLITWTAGGSAKMYPAPLVLAEIRKAMTIAAEADEKRFQVSKAAFLDELAELEQAVAEAVEKGLQVGLNCC